MSRVVVVGGGLGGTAVAARLAKLGHEVTLLERRDRLGGALGSWEQDGFRWDTGPTTTMLPAVLRDLFRKSGRPLEREVDLVPVEPLREHRFADGTRLSLPSGRADQQEVVDRCLGPGLGTQWVDYVHTHADAWDLLRRSVLERASPDALDPAATTLLRGRRTMARSATSAFTDVRLRRLALSALELDGQDARQVPAWMGMVAYLEQNFGLWTAPGGLGSLAGVLTRRLRERRVTVELDTTARDLVLRQGRVVAVRTDTGTADAEVVVCAVDPRGLPALAGLVRRTTAAPPPAVSHLGLVGPLPDLPHEVVLHGDPTLWLRTTGLAPEGGAAWTVLGHGRHSEDVVSTLARAGIDVRDQVEVRVDRSPREQVEAGGGSSYGVRWQGRRTLRHRPGPATPLAGVWCVGAHATLNANLPFVGLTAAVVAEQVGRAT